MNPQLTPELSQYIEQLIMIRTRLELAMIAKDEEINRLKKQVEELTKKDTPNA